MKNKSQNPWRLARLACLFRLPATPGRALLMNALKEAEEVL